MTRIRVVDHAEELTAVVRERAAMSEMSAFFHRALGAALAAAQTQGLQVTGAPVARYYGMPTDRVDVEAGFPVSAVVTAADGVVAGTLPAGQVAEAIHVGPYDTLGVTWEELFRWCAEEGLQPSDVFWEQYLTDPGQQQDAAAWQTLLCVLLAPNGP